MDGACAGQDGEREGAENDVRGGDACVWDPPADAGWWLGGFDLSGGAHYSGVERRRGVYRILRVEGHLKIPNRDISQYRTTFEWWESPKVSASAPLARELRDTSYLQT